MISDATCLLALRMADSTVTRDCPDLEGEAIGAAIIRTVHLLLSAGAYEKDGKLYLPDDGGAIEPPETRLIGTAA